MSIHDIPWSTFRLASVLAAEVESARIVMERAGFVLGHDAEASETVTGLCSRRRFYL